MTQCSLKDREHKIWQFQKIEELKFAKNHEILRKCSLCFFIMVPDIEPANIKPIKLLGKRNAASVKAGSCIAIRKKNQQTKGNQQRK